MAFLDLVLVLLVVFFDDLAEILIVLLILLHSTRIRIINHGLKHKIIRAPWCLRALLEIIKVILFLFATIGRIKTIFKTKR